MKPLVGLCYLQSSKIYWSVKGHLQKEQKDGARLATKCDCTRLVCPGFKRPKRPKRT